MIVFAVGECLHGTVQGPLVADLAEPRLIGRYMALSSLSWQIGFIVGPALGGVVLDAQPVALWPLAAAVCPPARCGRSLLLDRRFRQPCGGRPAGRRRHRRAPAPGVDTRSGLG